MIYKNRNYWISLSIGVVIGLSIAVVIYAYRDRITTWQLDHKQALLWELVIKAISGCVAITGAVVTAFKYIDDKSRQRALDRKADLLQIEQDRRDKRKSFLQERQAVYRRLGLSLARIMNYDPDDPEWNDAQEKFFEIYWGEIPFVADKAVMKLVESFSDLLYEVTTKAEKEALADWVNAITKVCRRSLGDEWEDIKKAEEQSSRL